MAPIRDIDFEPLFPESRRWSVCQVDTMKPPSDPECATKLFEVDSLEEAREAIEPQMGIIWIAYPKDGDGEAQILEP